MVGAGGLWLANTMSLAYGDNAPGGAQVCCGMQVMTYLGCCNRAGKVTFVSCLVGHHSLSIRQCNII